MRIVTDFWAKPGPSRKFDWTAVDDCTYDGAPDSNCPIGYGPTEQDAIVDLLDLTCRDHGADVGEDGACLYCDAMPGEACLAEGRVAKPGAA